MKYIDEKSPAKLNLILDVLDKREDGYHEILSVMQTVFFCDVLRLTMTERKKITMSSNLDYLPNDGDNLCVRAAYLFFKTAEIKSSGLHIHAHKQIPVAAGLGGGSANAAAVLRALNRYHGNIFTMDELVALAAKLGSDVPFCVRGGTQLAGGRGDVLEQLDPLPFCYVVLCKPQRKLSTASVFARFSQEGKQVQPDVPGFLEALKRQDLATCASLMQNALADEKLYEDLPDILGIMRDNGAFGAAMSGAGPTSFGLFESAEIAQVAARALQRKYEGVFVTSVRGSVDAE